MSADFGRDHAALSWRHYRHGDPVWHRPDEAHPPALGGPMKRQYPYATRLRQLPPYLFAEIDRLKQEAIKRGTDIIDLGVGDADLPTTPTIRRMRGSWSSARRGPNGTGTGSGWTSILPQRS